MKIFLVVLITYFVFLTFSQSEEPEILTNHNAQSCGGRCTELDLTTAITAAEEQAKVYFLQAKEAAIANQTDKCTSQVNEFDSQCNMSLFSPIKENADAIKKTLDRKMTGFNDISAIATNAKQRGSDIEEIVKNLQVLEDDIEAAIVFIKGLELDLTNLNKSCESGIKTVMQICSPPNVVSDGQSTTIYEKDLERPIKTSVQKAEASEGIAKATALATMNGELEATNITEIRAKTEDQFYTTTSRGISIVTGAVGKTLSYAIDSKEVVNNTIKSLNPLSGEGFIGICDEAIGDNCDTPPSDTSSPPTTSLRPQTRPATGTGGGTGEGTGGGSGAGTGGGATAAEVSENAYSGAYGATDTAGVDGSSNGSNGNGGLFAGGNGGGGLAGMLTGLGSFLGKTSSGSFGDSSSYGNTYTTTRSGSTGSAAATDSAYSSNGNAGQPYYNSSAYDYGSSQNQGRNLKTGSQNSRPRGFQPQGFGATSQAGNFAGQPQGGGGGLSGSSGSGSASNDNSKPSLFSKILGLKDRNMFGKASSSGGSSGSELMKSNAKSRLNSSGLNFNSSSSGANSNSPEGRTFDPNKYMPSKEAEERAYMRFTGQKVASRSLASATGSFEWPDEISKDKKRNLFKSVHLLYRAKLGQ